MDYRVEQPLRHRQAWPLMFRLAGLLVLFTGAELLSSVLAQLIPGLLTHAFILVTLLTMGVMDNTALSKLYTAMAVVPLIRLMSLSMPFWITDQTGYFALVNLPLILGTVVAISTLGYSYRALGLQLRQPAIQLLVVLSGALIGYIERLIIQPAPLSESLALSDIWLPALSLLLFTGLSEELLFRGLLQKAAVESLAVWPGIIYISLIFGVMHIGWNSVLDVAFVTLVGVYFGWVVHATKSLWGVTFAHGLANIMLFIVLPNLRGM
jgi:membrane protease YdiL (CAAX protease family)